MTAAQRAALIDEYGELSRQLATQKPLRDRFEALSKQIQGWYADSPADEPFSAQGKRYVILVGVREKQRTVTNPGWLSEWLGPERFVEHAKISLKIIDSVVPRHWHGEFITEARTGSRSLTPLPCKSLTPEKKVAA